MKKIATYSRKLSIGEKIIWIDMSSGKIYAPGIKFIPWGKKNLTKLFRDFGFDSCKIELEVVEPEVLGFDGELAKEGILKYKKIEMFE